MLRILLESPDRAPLRLLCVGAHSDDIEIGCGGTLLRLLDELPDVEVYWVVLSAAGERSEEAADSANRFFGGARRRELIIEQFEDGFFPFVGADIKRFFEKLKTQIEPDLILTHYAGDLHQDHRLVSELTWNTFRNHLILEYEILKYDGDFGRMNFFVELSEAVVRRKLDYLLEGFASQRDKAWFDERNFLAVLRLRGVEARSGSGLAEGFFARKVVY
jgi:LmbE family N-acetylglucosaminyl deacetylase